MNSEFSLLTIEKSEKMSIIISKEWLEVGYMQYESERIEYKSQMIDDIYKW